MTPMRTKFFPNMAFDTINIATKFHKVVIKISGLRDQTPSKMMFFYVQRAMTLKAWCNMEHYQTWF